MNSDLGQALSMTGTNNTWSTLDAIATKVKKRLGIRKISPKELDDLMLQVGDKELEKHGIWRTSFGSKFMPIVVINPGFGKTMAKRIVENPPPAASPSDNGEIQIQCTCSAAAGTGSITRGAKSNIGNNRDVSNDNAERYFSSQDYNAGRHATANSIHKFNCLMWRPSTTSHLHSWRRCWSQN